MKFTLKSTTEIFSISESDVELEILTTRIEGEWGKDKRYFLGREGEGKRVYMGDKAPSIKQIAKYIWHKKHLQSSKSSKKFFAI